MPLFTRSLQELTTASLEELSTNTNITKFTPGGKARAILDAVNKRIEEAYETFDINLARAFVSASPGQFLDLIGELLGVSRENSRSASVGSDIEVIRFFVNTGTFGDINNGANINVPTGTILSTGPNNTGVLFKTTESVILLASQSSQFIAAEASSPGETSNVGKNTLKFHSFTQYANYLDKSLKVTNLHPVANGRNFESDANFRFRITNRTLEAEAANQTAIRLSVLSTPGVADALLIPHYRGIGTFGVILQSTSPVVTDSLIDEVSARLQRTVSYGDLAYVRGPKETGVTMRINVHYFRNTSDDLIETIEDELLNAIEVHFSELDISDPLILNRLVSEMFEVSDNIANFGEAGKPIDEVFIYQASRVEGNRIRQKLVGDYYPSEDERIILEPSVASPVVFQRSFSRR